MPHEVEGQPHWHEPAGDDFAGLRHYPRPASPYERFMAQESVPVFRGVAIESLLALPVAPWARLGGHGAFVQLHGTEGRLGCQVVEIAGGTMLAPERHLYEEVMLVLEGRGSTELWQDDLSERHVFEWQRGAMFAVPRNAQHRLINATARPARLVLFNTAPGLIDLLGEARAVFASGFPFTDRLDAAELQPWDEVEPDPIDGLACTRTAHLPDAIGCDLPLDNRASPGSRRLGLEMTGGVLRLSLQQIRQGRYGRALWGQEGVALTVGGWGETLLWRSGNPIENGQHLAAAPFGLVSLAPEGPGFSQHFNRAAVPLRQLVVTLAQPGIPGMAMRDEASLPVSEGGAMVPFAVEEPEIRAWHANALARLAVDNRMHAAFYLP